MIGLPKMAKYAQLLKCFSFWETRPLLHNSVKLHKKSHHFLNWNLNFIHLILCKNNDRTVEMSSSETIWTILNHSDLLQNTLGIIIILSWKYVTPQYYGLKDKTRVKETTGRLPFSPEIFGKKGEEWVVWCHCCIVVVISPNLEKIGHYTPLPLLRRTCRLLRSF